MSTILEIANADKNLSTLVKGFKAVNMEDKLKETGPFTILGPVNLAFGNLNSPDSFAELVKHNDKNNRLEEILSLHILKGKKLVKDFRNGQKLETISGKELDVTVKDGEVRINGAKILARDRQGSNGVVHSVDIVSLPAISIL